MLFSTSISLFDSIGGVTFEMAADASVKAALLLAMTAILAFLLRKSSAAVRHRLWSLCFCGVILLPGLSLALPQWRLPVLPTQTVESSPPVAAVDLEAQPANSAFAASPVRHDNALSNDAMAYELPRPVEAALIGAETSPLVEMPGNRLKSQPALAEADAISAPHAATHADWPTWLTAGWLMGLTLMISPLIVGLFANWRMRRRSNRLHDSRWTSLVNEFANRLGLTRAVTLLETYLPVLPMTWGVMRPVILLPRESNDWSDRMRIVLVQPTGLVRPASLADRARIGLRRLRGGGGRASLGLRFATLANRAGLQASAAAGRRLDGPLLDGRAAYRRHARSSPLPLADE